MPEPKYVIAMGACMITGGMFSVDGNCVEFCPTKCLSLTEEYELAVYDRHELNLDNVALGRLPYKVTDDPMVTPLRELVYLPKGVLNPHEVPLSAQRAGKFPQEILKEHEAGKAETPRSRVAID